MKRLLLLCSLAILIYGCADHPSMREQKVATFDINDYYYSADSLKSPKVFVYADRTTGVKLYQKLESDCPLENRIVSMTTYDNSFTQIYFEKNKIGKDSIRILEFSYKASGDEQSTDFIITKYINPRIKPIGKTISYEMESAKKKTKDDIARKLTALAHFSKNSPPLKPLVYYNEDCIKMECQNIMTPLDTFQKTKTSTYNMDYYYARGLGLIYFEISDPKREHINRIYLEKIISLNEFNKMKAKNHSI